MAPTSEHDMSGDQEREVFVATEGIIEVRWSSEDDDFYREPLDLKDLQDRVRWGATADVPDLLLSGKSRRTSATRTGGPRSGSTSTASSVTGA